MLLATVYITTDPAWPWSLPAVGVTALVGVALALAALTVWTYLGVAKATPRRVGTVLLLRLLALAVAIIVVLRPSLAQDDADTSLASKMLVHLDVSESMETTDELNNASRYDEAKRLLTTAPVAELLKRLASERKIEIAYSMGADDVKPLEFPAKPTGKRTDIGGWLHELWQRHGQEPNLRGLVLFTDGADNGTRFAVLEEAAKFRGLCPIYPIALGRTDTTGSHKDVSIDRVWVEPAPLHAKGKMTVKAALAAPGFEDAVLNVSLWLEEGKTMKQVGPKQAVDLRRLPEKIGVFTADTPDREGELKVTVKVDPLPGEVNVANNESSTYVHVSKEGISILWVEGKRRYETVDALRALAKDGRMRVYTVVKQQQANPRPEQADLLDLDKKRYDVIVIGDISAQRFSGGKKDIFDKISEMVQTKGTGLLLVGGYDTFRAGGWQNSPLASLLPAKFDQGEQVEAKIAVEPTSDGEKFLLRLSDNPAKQKELWSKILEPLDGMADLGTLEPTATPYAWGVETVTKKKHPLMASVDRGQGRVLVFGGDTSYLAWRRSQEGIAAHERFWTQLMLWLAKQEHSKGSLTVKPDTRRLEIGKNERLGFTVNFIKGTAKVQEPKFEGKIIGPKGEEYPVNIVNEGADFRGYWSGPTAAGEYRIAVKGEGVDDKKQAVTGEDAARFMVYDEDRESLHPAADHELLQKIAAASGGELITGEGKLVQFLQSLQPLQDAGRSAKMRWPDWRRNPASSGVRDQVTALWESSALISFLAFATLLCLEWFLRRRWGMV